ncbi:uncharacterized protein SPAPADRAFT_62056 [Spathaspora passalidarum NRRL Y-27907]|uniref:Uncharacterized protein n=1 Tax=Spathaspora passalidarum (strain NRRL Y-27907 / 11-Y1) TaxID=619300 RepID=G3AQD9_SPAPN|nr:uncharacterized protein SPAPADRAFT_62056 [Spathaspora passalidarum NRRL Y-27907]EGW31485.1 hypothetical protein SPAPADRAFT_62056 [Spathaspora passalidarum NRRL Y-27907]
MTLIDDAVSRSTKGEVIRYNDITQAINVKLMNYNVHDRNIERYNRGIQHRFEYYRSKVQESEETDPNNLLMVKKSNKNIYTAEQGVVLLNMSTLDEFVNLHMKYALDSKFHKYTRTFFINCLFAHLMTFGNFTALVNAMNGLSRVSRDWKGDLDYDSFKIIFTAMGNSESSKRCAYEFFTYFKRHSKKISRGYYIGMIKAASYGYVDYGVQFYIYHYLKDFGNLPESIIRLLPKSETMEQLVEFCSSRNKLTPEEIENYWATNNLNNSPDKLFREEENTNPQRYIPRYDERDVELLQKLLT